jgi:hypothetical protein
MTLESIKGASVYIVGYDPASPKTEYFTRFVQVKGLKELEFNCPQSPKSIRIIAWSKGRGKFKIGNVRKQRLERQLNATGQDQHPDIKFIEVFARKMGRLPARRTYRFPKASYKIQLLPVIYNDAGREHTTPARIHIHKPIIQVSKKHFDSMSIPQRVAILAHEYSHNFINIDQDSEIEADTNMTAIYDGLGYGRIEAVYAFANVMKDTDENYQRLSNIYRQL